MRRLRIGDRILRVRDEGESNQRPALVCVHGAGSSSVIFMDVVRRLSPRRRMVALDLPGHGQSDRWLPPSEVSIDSYRDAVGTVCAHLGIERAVLLGHSMGAQVALAAAAAWPERVAGLVLVNSGARIAVTAALFERLASDFARFGKWFARLLWSPSTPLDVVERWGAIALTAEPEIVEADFRAVERFDGEPLLARVTAPTLIFAGADDLLTPPKLAQALQTGIRGARAVVVPDAGHMVAQEQPETFFAELEAFLVTSGV
jgi:pimeloyl-ACP methyl ester carboxylesterase